MKNIIPIFYQIQRTPSKIEKEQIIRNNSDNELFKKCLKFLFDTQIITGISQAKINKKIKRDIEPNSLTTFEQCITYLKTNNTGSDLDILSMQEFIGNQLEQYNDFYKQMITKSFKIGCDSKTVNKAIPNLIPTFNVMLGTSIENCNIPKDVWFSISQKLNGSRCVFINGEFFTRSGKKYCGLEHIKEEIVSIFKNHNDMVLDGELIYRNEENLIDSDAFQKGIGISNSKEKNKPELRFIIFDVIPKNEFLIGKSIKTYRDRLTTIQSMRCLCTKVQTKNVEVISVLYCGEDQSNVESWLEKAEGKDWEGIMVNLDAPYECKRTKSLIKVKKFKEIDLRCIKINIATNGKYKGIIGSITCKYGDFTVDVGSGFSDEIRKFYTEYPEEILNKIISIKYKEETKSKTGNKSLQFPIFINCRSDKLIADDEEGK